MPIILEVVRAPALVRNSDAKTRPEKCHRIVHNFIMSDKSKEIHEDEESRFQMQIDRISENLNNLAKQQGVENSNPIIVQTHDSIEKSIDTIIQLIQKNQPILLVGKSKTINKLISMVEISKTKIAMNQFNKLMQQSSVANGNYSKKLTSEQKQNLSLESPLKVFLLPILFIYLVPKNVDIELDWTSQ